MTTHDYQFTTWIESPLAGAETRVREQLAREGFGVLTEVDVAATFESKLGQAFRPYRILGACNPGLAMRSLTAVPGVGVLLPCNVVLEEPEAGRTLVRFMEPLAALSMISNDAITAVAREASDRLHRVADSLGAAPVLR